MGYSSTSFLRPSLTTLSTIVGQPLSPVSLLEATKSSRSLQHGDDPVPLDYRDLVTRFHSLDQIDGAIAEFAPRVTEAWQTGRELPTGSPGTFLETLNLGASSAENELRDLSYYFLRTDAYQRAQRGDVRLVVGRKGSGKTAVFAQTRDNLRRNKQNIILDLRPEGYKLLKFKEDVLVSRPRRRRPKCPRPDPAVLLDAPTQQHLSRTIGTGH